MWNVNLAWRGAGAVNGASMEFQDRAVIAVSTPVLRSNVFSDVALKNIVKAAYGLDEAVLQGAATANYSSFTLGGLDMPGGEQETPPEPSPNLRIDALWRGSVRIAARFPKARIDSASFKSLSLKNLDADVAAANGGNMPVGEALEAARRAALKARIAQLANQAATANDAVVDLFLRKSGANGMAALVARPDAAQFGQMQLAISEALGGDAFAQMDFPVAVAILIRDPAVPGFSLAAIIAAARQVQQQMRHAGFQPAEPSPAGGMGKAIIALVVPMDWFNDADWPGADPQARIAASGAWMAGEGIGLVAAKLDPA